MECFVQIVSMFQWENQRMGSVLRVGEALTKDKKSCARAFSSAVIIVARVRKDGVRRATIRRDLVDEVTGRRSRDRRTQRAATPVSSSARDIQISNTSPEKKGEEEEEDVTSTASLSGLYTRQGIGWPSPY
ncbi:hypothetical protein TRV_01578 [Trichophyton verrucosum HKI 0517]|uniref:Uncharacterized protein n=1 Tax=Trichophyton verrucosum (strain HKI 0517) TaxID=663202 RepID=D4D3B9_TRIVH|nr:uncharacterized protein TRV_01578 [Trichophyton verrucosum HKI 0517]EFE43617.1 hypothetical protein TRV_01578 [Trichophyton verrucosum HKI 0517]